MHVRMRALESLNYKVYNFLCTVSSTCFVATASEKNICDLSLFEKGRKVQKYLMYLTSSKVVKETLVSFESNYEIDAS